MYSYIASLRIYLEKQLSRTKKLRIAIYKSITEDQELTINLVYIHILYVKYIATAT